jgi:hypothetical protein
LARYLPTAPGTKELIDKCVKIIIVLSLKVVTAATLNNMLPSGIPITDRVFSDANMQSGIHEVPCPTTVAVIDGIKSVTELTDRLHSNLEIISKVK